MLYNEWEGSRQFQISMIVSGIKKNFKSVYFYCTSFPSESTRRERERYHNRLSACEVVIVSEQCVHDGTEATPGTGWHGQVTGAMEGSLDRLRTQERLEARHTQWHPSPGWVTSPSRAHQPGFGTKKVNTWTDVGCGLLSWCSRMSKGIRMLRALARGWVKWWIRRL